MSLLIPQYTLTVHLNAKDHRAFVNARRRLRRKMGLLAPTLAMLCSHQLSGRDAAGLTDDYLAAIDWPFNLSLGSGRSKTRRTAKTLGRFRLASSHLRIDPTRN
jgi:hypothetical protein